MIVSSRKPLRFVPFRCCSPDVRWSNGGPEPWVAARTEIIER